MARGKALDGDGSTDDPSLVARGREWLDGLRAGAYRRFEDRRTLPLVDLAARVVERDRAAAGPVVGSAVAFRLFLFFVPLLLLLVGLLGFARGTIGPEHLDTAGIGGSAATQIEAALDQSNSSRWFATLSGLFGMLSAGRTLSKTMAQASILSWGLSARPKPSARVVGGVVGVIVGMALVALIVNRIRISLGLGVTGLSFLAAMALYLVAWMVVFALLPRNTSELSVLLPGAVLMAATITGMQAVSQLVLSDRFSKASNLYGSLGASVVVLGWFFFAGRAIVLSMTLNAAVHERFGTIAQFVFSLPVLRSITRRSVWLRRTFGLDEPDG